MQYLCLHQSNFFLNAKKWKTDDGFSYRVKLTKKIVPNVLKICLENKKKPTQHLPSKYQKEICHTMTKRFLIANTLRPTFKSGGREPHRTRRVSFPTLN